MCWFSRTQKYVTLSTSKAKYIALDDADKELLFLRHVWHFMLPGKGMPCFADFEDNQGVAQLSRNPVPHSNSKHIDVRHHFLRELVHKVMLVELCTGTIRRTNILNRYITTEL